MRSTNKKGEQIMYDLDSKINFSVFPGLQVRPDTRPCTHHLRELARSVSVAEDACISSQPVVRPTFLWGFHCWDYSSLVAGTRILYSGFDSVFETWKCAGTLMISPVARRVAPTTTPSPAWRVH